jgi:hypothetical protein
MEIAQAQASLPDSRLYHQHGNWALLTTGGTCGTDCNEPGDFVNRIIYTAVILFLVSNQQQGGSSSNQKVANLRFGSNLPIGF